MFYHWFVQCFIKTTDDVNPPISDLFRDIFCEDQEFETIH